jgi:pyruvate kinase
MTRLALIAIGALALCASTSNAYARGRTEIGIISSVGNASASPAVLEAMCRAGNCAFRYNLAHKDKRAALAEAAMARGAARKAGLARPIFLFDLPGGKIRTGLAPAGGAVELRVGQPFALAYGRSVRPAPATADGATVDHPRLGDYARPGARVILHQGKIELEVTAVEPGRVLTRVVRVDPGARLQGHATVNLVGEDPAFPLMTAQDRRKLKIAVAAGATHIGVSMVQTPAQMRAVRRALDRLGAKRVKLVAKIETLSAMKNLEEIARLSDIVMIARGDLRTALVTPEALHAAEQKIAAVCKKLGKQFIDATGFEGPNAAQEVANARSLGTRYILLKNTAVAGHDPVQIVSRLHDLLR